VETLHDARARILQITITDTGRGIEPVAAGKIFQPFFTTKKSGTGLGLSIAKRLIEQHGGSIRAENNRKSGAAFTLTLPVYRERERIQ
jgi:signal transduction histidine kinase